MSDLPPVEKMPPFRYTDAAVPAQYHCGKCGAHGVRLWRSYQTFLNHQSLLCAACACKEQGNPQRVFSVRVMDDGRARVTATIDGDDHPYMDTIGWRVPAVPTEDGGTYWGYTSVPRDGVVWWNRLPLEAP